MPVRRATVTSNKEISQAFWRRQGLAQLMIGLAKDL